MRPEPRPTPRRPAQDPLKGLWPNHLGDIWSLQDSFFAMHFPRCCKLRVSMHFSRTARTARTSWPSQMGPARTSTASSASQLRLRRDSVRLCRCAFCPRRLRQQAREPEWAVGRPTSDSEEKFEPRSERRRNSRELRGSCTAPWTCPAAPAGRVPSAAFRTPAPRPFKSAPRRRDAREEGTERRV